MKKACICIWLLIMTSVALSQSQEDRDNHLKYWYYKWRLNNNFLKVGEGNGYSIPSRIRPRAEGAITWSDGGIEMGFYLMMLATEYKLLSDNNQNLSEISKELYYALEQINRMDYFAETFTYKNNNGNFIPGISPSLNGFFVRDVVPDGFGPNNFLGDQNDPNSNYQHFNSGIVSYANIAFPTPHVNVKSDFEGGIDPFEISIDQAAFLVGGLACINRFVDQDANHNNLLFRDQLTPSIFIESGFILDRLMNYMRNLGWCLKNPVLDEPVRGTCSRPNNCTSTCGNNAIPYSYGYAAAANILFGGAPNDAPYQNITSLTLGLLSWQALEAIGGSSQGDAHDQMTIAASGNSWNIIKMALGGVLYEYEWCSLLQQALWNTPNLIQESNYRTLLNSAPECGPYNFGGSNYPDELWSVSSTLRFPENRGVSNNLGTQGEYNGVDYMVLHNLYYIVRSELYDALNLIDFVVPNGFNFPIPSPGPDIGSHALPGIFTGFHSVTAADNILFPDADMTYRAGVEINLLPGFEVKAGADFLATIDPVKCENQSYSRTGGDSLHILTDVVPYLSQNDNTDSSLNATRAMMDEKDKFSITPTLLVMPNPNEGSFTIFWPVVSMNTSIEIFDVLGNRIYSGASQSYYQEITLQNLGKGIYFIRASNREGAAWTERIIIR